MLAKKIKGNGQAVRELLQALNWDESREEVSRESRSRILILGLAEAGKSMLLNQLCGWTVSEPGLTLPAGLETNVEAVEDFGLFQLVTLPQQDAGQARGSGFYEQPISPYGYIGGADTGGPYINNFGSLPVEDPLELAEVADLLLYVIDGPKGVRAADYRWVGRLRRLDIPLLVVLNKCDLIEEHLAARQKKIEKRLASKVLPVSALEGSHIWDKLLPKMVKMCPKLTLALGRELPQFRSQAARRLIQQTAIINGIVALEPVPLIDLPIQIMTLTGLMLRLAALYDRPATGVRRREVFLAAAGGLGARYGAQQLAKIVPVVGWLISGFIGWSCTWLLGRTAVAYFEAGGDDAIDRSWGRTKGGMGRVRRAMGRRWQRRPRLLRPGRWKRQKSTPVEPEE